MVPIKLGEKLQALLDLRGYTQAMLELRSGVKQAHISQIINGQRHPRFEIVVAMADALDVSLDWLAGRDRRLQPGTLQPDEAELLRLYRAIADPQLRGVALNSVRLQSEYDQLQRD